MGRRMFYWVMQRVGSGVFAHGPYKSEQARDNRFDRVEGGEAFKFNSSTSDRVQAVQEFRDEESRGIG